MSDVNIIINQVLADKKLVSSKAFSVDPLALHLRI